MGSFYIFNHGQIPQESQRPRALGDRASEPVMAYAASSLHQSTRQAVFKCLRPELTHYFPILHAGRVQDRLPTSDSISIHNQPHRKHFPYAPSYQQLQPGMMTSVMSGTSAIKHRRASDSDPDDEEHATKKPLTASAANMIASSRYVAGPVTRPTQPLGTATLDDDYGEQTETQQKDNDQQREQPQATAPEDKVGTGDFRHHKKYVLCNVETQDKRKGAIKRIQFYTGVRDPYQFIRPELRAELALPPHPRDASTTLMTMIASLCELVRQDRERAWRLVDEAISARSHDSEALFSAKDLTLALRRGAEEDGEARQRLREETSGSANVEGNDSSPSPQASTKKDEVREPEQQHATQPSDTSLSAAGGLGSRDVPSARMRGNSLDIRRLSATFESTKLEDTIPGADPHLLDLQYEEAEADHRMKRIKINRYLARRINKLKGN
ncbi:hypothetical protein LTR56_018428 [Elasticomyces elasticus]|nr:hypothetical protein LTR56_018428 [Elasticomyces elasticus]KAK3655792.1 hypothetical protein LTR22_010086 [Elasticomyces elasticus]KAK4912006.1 hypothetical protein LTR49_019476 [Elasticomyces elasticus]KAK5756783.1 hypothetical protein LTS12_013116 [Elasticomyces elasticus]